MSLLKLYLHRFYCQQPDGDQEDKDSELLQLCRTDIQTGSALRNNLSPLEHKNVNTDVGISNINKSVEVASNTKKTFASSIKLSSHY